MAVFSVPIKLDKERNLKYGFGAMIAIEDLTGKGFLELVSEMKNPKKLKIKTVRDILWAGLVHEDETLTPNDVTRILDNADDIQNLIIKINEAFGTAFSGDEGNAKAGATEKE